MMIWFDRINLKLKLLGRSHYVLGFRRQILHRLGLKCIRFERWEMDLGSPIPDFTAKIPVELRILSLEDLSSERFKGAILASSDDPLRHKKAEMRIREGDTCIVGLSEDRLGGFLWLRMGKSRYEAVIETSIPISNGEALIYDAFNSTQFRRLGAGAKALEGSLRLLKSRGFKDVIAWVEADNVPPQKVLEAVGFHRTGTITYIKVLCFTRIVQRPIGRGLVRSGPRRGPSE